MDGPTDTSSERRIRVFCVNDHPILLEGLKRFFLLEPWTEVVGVGRADEDLIEKVAAAEPDVVILDPGQRRAELAEIISQLHECVPGMGVIAFLLHEGYVSEPVALAAGADAFVAKDHAVEDLLAAVRLVARR
jgi:DNA-binding NarL/FixJ family response regulator